MVRAWVDVHELILLTLQYITLYRARLPRRMIKVKRALCLYVVIPAITQSVVFAD
jgi:hypothetical protein